jgi:hypothetical protein
MSSICVDQCPMTNFQVETKWWNWESRTDKTVRMVQVVTEWWNWVSSTNQNTQNSEKWTVTGQHRMEPDINSLTSGRPLRWPDSATSERSGSTTTQPGFFFYSPTEGGLDTTLQVTSNSALVYESQCGWIGQWVQLCTSRDVEPK